jgi:hypothetical protein
MQVPSLIALGPMVGATSSLAALPGDTGRYVLSLAASETVIALR